MPVLIFLTIMIVVTQLWWLLLYLIFLGWLIWLGVSGWRLVLAAVLVWLAVLGGVALAPDSAFARLIGWSPQGLVSVLLVIALLFGAEALVAALHAHAMPLPDRAPGLVPLSAAAKPAPQPASAQVMQPAELDRYARHIVLRELGGPGQAALRRARVLVVGAGGLGAPVCQYLAAAGVGRITVADDDRVSLSNLQRQVIFRSKDDGQPKAQAARAAMLALNPHIEVTALARRITAEDAALIAEQDLVIDGTDSFTARQAINAACVAAGVPLVAGAIAQWEGQVTVWDPKRGAPCMSCIFPQAPAPGLAPACVEAGVVGPLPGVIGSMMALEAIKIIAGAGEPLRGRMLIFDGLYGENRLMKIARRGDCPVCGSGHFAQG
ncbi:HesA/MoeB/ThiF family protein [Paracoccus lutimaris]|uniref:Molybdopterin-synthase adenylyltransferase n=1 Tax=Paracoccus lutimaris TaxID=1490030 RepID=A0A368Z4G7_9RHOB|nr:molybdopterin-synthase adenylyltransferase MoeB [Paracoccus lutimaris]RCW86668.1 molybdopterin/thiamine biosynthesis adenylyltransferase [Paracoccus lutimaris]